MCANFYRFPFFPDGHLDVLGRPHANRAGARPGFPAPRDRGNSQHRSSTGGTCCQERRPSRREGRRAKPCQARKAGSLPSSPHAFERTSCNIFLSMLRSKGGDQSQHFAKSYMWLNMPRNTISNRNKIIDSLRIGCYCLRVEFYFNQQGFF